MCSDFSIQFGGIQFVVHRKHPKWPEHIRRLDAKQNEAIRRIHA
jgi:hypothetical protein